VRALPGLRDHLLVRDGTPGVPEQDFERLQRLRPQRISAPSRSMRPLAVSSVNGPMVISGMHESGTSESAVFSV
jgi:hypothetical protein